MVVNDPSTGPADVRVSEPFSMQAWPNIWLDEAYIMSLPMSGPAWEALRGAATGPMVDPDLSDQEDKVPVLMLAAALYYVRTKDPAAKQTVEDRCMAAIGTERGGRALSYVRMLPPILFAADLVGFRDPEFVAWVDSSRSGPFSGGPRTLTECHEQRPNNWGTHAGCARVAAAMYLRDLPDLRRAAIVFKGWLGDRYSYAGFEYGELDWQSDPPNPVGVNPKNALLHGLTVDGCLPDDQRRGGGFSWPPPAENYVREALMGVVPTAHLLQRCGYTPWTWSDAAILRAVKFHVEAAGGVFEGDDQSTIWIVNWVYRKRFTSSTPAHPGKNFGWTDWTHAR